MIILIRDNKIITDMRVREELDGYNVTELYLSQNVNPLTHIAIIESILNEDLLIEAHKEGNRIFIINNIDYLLKIIKYKIDDNGVSDTILQTLFNAMNASNTRIITNTKDPDVLSIMGDYINDLEVETSLYTALFNIIKNGLNDIDYKDADEEYDNFIEEISKYEL